MLKSYAFDVDSNLVFTEDTLWIDTLEDNKRVPKEISQQDYEKFLPEILNGEKMRYSNDNKEDTMINFRALGMYEKSVFDAIQKKKF